MELRTLGDLLPTKAVIDRPEDPQLHHPHGTPQDDRSLDICNGIRPKGVLEFLLLNLWMGRAEVGTVRETVARIQESSRSHTKTVPTTSPPTSPKI